MRKNSTPARGLWIAFYGPDGVGKSAVIEHLGAELNPWFAAVRQFHFRPRFRTQGVHRPAVIDPHAKPPRGGFISLLKLLYWLIDCWTGYLLTICPGRRRSELIFFDRYFHDITVDPVRYRLPRSTQWLAPWLAKLAPHPDLCVLLNADWEVVQTRKREVSPSESRRQQKAYLALLDSLRHPLLVDAQAPVPQVALRIAALIYAGYVVPAFDVSEASSDANL